MRYFVQKGGLTCSFSYSPFLEVQCTLGFQQMLDAIALAGLRLVGAPAVLFWWSKIC